MRAVKVKMDQVPEESGAADELLAHYPPEKVDAALERMAELGLLNHLLPDLTEAYKEAGINLRDDGIVHAILVTLRIIEDEMERLTGAFGGDTAGRLVRSTARALTDQTCATVKANVVRQGYWATRHATP